MNSRLHQFICYFFSFTAAYFVNFIYTFKANVGMAFAADIVPNKPCSTSTIYSYYYGNCSPSNPVLPYGSICGTAVSQFCKSYNQPGWTCNNVLLEPSTAKCDCSSVNYYSTIYLHGESMACGYRTMCGTSVQGVSCSTGPFNAGYDPQYSSTGGGTTCICCPPNNSFKPADSTTTGVYSNASSASCYLKGIFVDEKGLIEFTDANRCYYTS